MGGGRNKEKPPEGGPRGCLLPVIARQITVPKQSRDRFTQLIHFHPHLGPPPSVGGGKIWKVTMIGFAMTNHGNYSNHFRHSGHGGCREPESMRDSDLRIRTGFQIPRLRHLRAGSARNYVTAGQRFPP